MRLATLIVPSIVCLSLCAQDDLAPRLARAQGERMEQVLDLQARVAAASATPEQKAYSEALLGYCTVNLIRGKDPKQAEAVLDRTVKALEGRKDAESMALLGACLGQKISFSPAMAMFLSSKASGLFEEAAKLSPTSPRVLVLQGVNILHTPKFFGGGAENALPILKEAVKAAEAEAAPKEPWAPRWGKVESLSWLAIAQGEAGLIAEAEATLIKAKAADPAHGFTNYATRRVAASKAKKS